MRRSFHPLVWLTLAAFVLALALLLLPALQGSGYLPSDHERWLRVEQEWEQHEQRSLQWEYEYQRKQEIQWGRDQGSTWFSPRDTQRREQFWQRVPPP